MVAPEQVARVVGGVLNTLRRRGDVAGTNPRDLARSSLITSGAMTSRLDRLERAGLVRRGPRDTVAAALKQLLLRSEPG